MTWQGEVTSEVMEIIIFCVAAICADAAMMETVMQQIARAGQYNTWLVIELTPKGVVFSFLFFHAAKRDAPCPGLASEWAVPTATQSRQAQCSTCALPGAVHGVRNAGRCPAGTAQHSVHARWHCSKCHGSLVLLPDLWSAHKVAVSYMGYHVTLKE